MQQRSREAVGDDPVPGEGKPEMIDDASSAEQPGEIEPAKLIAEAVRSIRRARHMKTSEVAAAMGMPTRTYELFESGKGKITYARISRFAEATNSDPAAILISILLKSPGFAVRCMDNKFATVAMAALRDLDDELGADLSTISSANAITAFEKMGKDLIAHLRRQDPFTDSWMQERASRIAGAEFLRERPEALSRRD